MKLNVIETSAPKEKAGRERENPRDKARAIHERRWMQKEECTDVAMEKERIRRSGELMLLSINPSGKKACDLGAGAGLFSLWLEERGAIVDAVDIAMNALQKIKPLHQNIRLVQDFVPATLLDDSSYEIVAALDLIAEMPEKDYRLFFMEVARLLKKEGVALISTPIDFRSENALDLFFSLAKTELELTGCALSYHYFSIKLADFLKAPARFHRASHDPVLLARMLEERSGLRKAWFRLCSKRVSGALFGYIAPLTSWLQTKTGNSLTILQLLERISKSLKGDSAITHVIVSGIRKSLVPDLQGKAPLPERKTKKQIWE
ncbi:class I SAM-dependent methyltransferase [Estrella lausannensis]|uniref:Methyltransferase n=1 Tax=Estrella lausannensis TaxID=483423 RepID=A0A0H5DSD8_9BACT|nr:class I SAM-dependent methyltransferase [Estrella lausannensis]CRX38679.1 Methyltransferase [Estrella lausannensis]